MVSKLFNPADWQSVEALQFKDITYHEAITCATVRIAFNRPECRNAFRPETVDELYTALNHAVADTRVGVILLTGNGPSPKDGGWAFCAGGDQRIRGRDGYQYNASENTPKKRQGRLHMTRMKLLKAGLRFLKRENPIFQNFRTNTELIVYPISPRFPGQINF